MSNNAKTEKQKKIDFSPEIDRSINGFALGISFSLISAFLLWKNDYFFLPIISYIIGAILGIVGVCSCAIEMGKIIKVKGIPDFIVGAIFILIWCILYFLVDVLVLNILGLFVLLFGAYGTISGLIKIIYSFIENTKNKKDGFKNGLLLLTQSFGLILTILNILKIFGLFS